MKTQIIAVLFAVLISQNLYAGNCTFDAKLGTFTVQKTVEIEGSHKCATMLNNVIKNFRAGFFKDEAAVRKAYCGLDKPEVIDYSYRVQYNVDGTPAKKMTRLKKDFCVTK